MQLKKPTRDAQYAEPDEFEEPAEPANEAYPVGETPGVRTRRAPELEGETPTRPAAAAARQESVVDSFSSFDGKYETQHDLRVQGAVSGEVICRGMLTVEAEATVRARIQTRDAHIHGRLEGDIACSGRLVLAATANVSGTIKAATLVVEEGATLAGNVEASQSVRPEAPAAPARPATPPIASIDDQRQERRAATEPVAATAPTPARNGRQAPSFAFVPSDERRPDRN